MNKFFEVTVAVEIAILKSGKAKLLKEVYLVDALSVTEAETRLVYSFEKAGMVVDYKVIGAKQSRIIRVIT